MKSQSFKSYFHQKQKDPKVHMKKSHATVGGAVNQAVTGRKQWNTNTSSQTTGTSHGEFFFLNVAD